MTEKAFLAGMEAYKQDTQKRARERQANPYEAGAAKSDPGRRGEDISDWRAGYDAAREEDQSS